jgi:erythromycin esterase-like protein
MTRRHTRPLHGRPTVCDALSQLIGDARAVTIGGAMHGAHQFYKGRSRLTEKSIVACGFTAVAIKSGALEAWRINRCAHGFNADTSRDALSACRECPQWLWRNLALSAFLVWLYAFSAIAAHHTRQVSVFGLDPLSFFSSTAALIRFLAHEDPSAAEHARR